MEIRQIKTFLSVAETLHFGKSARLLHLSQPALSLQIKALEEELGIKLLSRDRQGTALTAAGQVFQANATVALEQLESARRKAQWAAAGKIGLIRIGFISTAGQEMLPALIRRFRRSFPEVEFSLRNILTSEQTDLIKSGHLDIGFLRLPIERTEEMEVTTVHREPFVVIVPSNHRLASSREIRLRELRGEKFVMYDRTFAPGFHDLILGLLHGAEIIPLVSQGASEMPTIVSLVASGMGAAIVPESAARQRVARIASCQILDRIPLSDIGMVTRRVIDSPAVAKFCEMVRSRRML